MSKLLAIVLVLVLTVYMGVSVFISGNSSTGDKAIMPTIHETANDSIKNLQDLNDTLSNLE
ncbi:MAG: hypothetical protein APF76_04840 [Desulfitibacter sp. BRH_c19]|nr:MAG: hypothetical protein APF76_04840 [Desulfitibacter sp. BRH_c19]